MNSRVVLIGLANKPSEKEFDTEVIFEVYQESQILDIMKSLTENLIDDKGAAMIAKTTTADGDIRPVTTLALSCFEFVENKMAESETGAEDLLQPASAVVNMLVVHKVKAQSRPMDMKEKLQSLTNGARLTLVSVALQYSVGELFTFSSMVDLLNTHLEHLQLPRCDGTEAGARLEELMNASFMNAVSKNTNSRHISTYSIGVNASDLLQENCREVLLIQNWNLLANVVKCRELQRDEDLIRV
jgi:hypothetical protein